MNLLLTICLLSIIFPALLVDSFETSLLSRSLIHKKMLSKLQMSDNSEEGFVPGNEVPSKNQFFDGNKRVRLGRSKDQDGKSNIWSIEPTMEVQEEDEDSTKKNLVILGSLSEDADILNLR
jgi:hypothetical protein